MNTQLSHGEAQARSSEKRQGPVPRPSSHRQTIIILSACMALQMTSFVIILPLFARRFNELGAGVEALGISAMAYALTAMLAAPFMGALADRLGRRRLVLVSLAAYVFAFTGYLFVSSVLAFILCRALAGALTAGLVPAVTSIVADTAPADRKAQSIGIVNGGASVGWIAGPILGGLLYDRWGYSAALGVSIVMALITFLMALFMVPDTGRNPGRTARTKVTDRRVRPRDLKSSLSGFRDTLPRSLPGFLAQLGVSFAVMFAWAFMEPRFMFYAYDDLAWSSSMLGLVMSTFGVAMVFGEFLLARLSDHLGRKPIVVCGLLLFTAQFLGLAFSRNYILIAVAFVVAGLGNALFDPALTASVLDTAPAAHQGRILGLKSTASSLGNILGPALVILFTPFLAARGVFLASTAIVCLSIVFFLAVQRKTGSIGLRARDSARESIVTSAD